MRHRLVPVSKDPFDQAGPIVWRCLVCDRRWIGTDIGDMLEDCDADAS